jgi:cobalt transporter subunit CbtB
MDATTDAVTDRIERARVESTPAKLAVGLALVAAVGFVLLFMQDPMVHDSLHNFRHAAGVTCH